MGVTRLDIALTLVFAYLLGSIPSGVWIGKYFYKIDIREHGSGNMGTTNSFRVLGKKAGIFVLFMDILKGSIATWLPMWFDVPIHPLLVGVVAALGHTLPIFANFRGGKAVATSAGIILAYNPLFFALAIICFLISLYITSMVSFSSIAACVSAVIISLFMADFWLTIVTLALSIFIIYRHRENIDRIRKGTENLVPFGLKYNKKNNK